MASSLLYMSWLLAADNRKQLLHFPIYRSDFSHQDPAPADSALRVRRLPLEADHQDRPPASRSLRPPERQEVQMRDLQIKVRRRPHPRHPRQRGSQQSQGQRVLRLPQKVLPSPFSKVLFCSLARWSDVWHSWLTSEKSWVRFLLPSNASYQSLKAVMVQDNKLDCFHSPGFSSGTTSATKWRGLFNRSCFCSKKKKREKQKRTSNECMPHV